MPRIPDIGKIIDQLDPRLHVACVMTISLAAPIAAVLITVGITTGNETWEFVGISVWALAALGGFALDHAIRSIVKKEGLIKGWLVELDIHRIQGEVFRSRTLRKTLDKLGRNPNPTIGLRRATFICSALVVATLIVHNLIYGVP